MQFVADTAFGIVLDAAIAMKPCSAIVIRGCSLADAI